MVPSRASAINRREAISIHASQVEALRGRVAGCDVLPGPIGPIVAALSAALLA